MTMSLTLAEGIGLRTADAARQMILEAFRDADAVELVLPDGAPIDLCGVQLIEAARTHARAVGKSVTLAGSGEALRPVLESAGFLTGASPETLGFWLHEGTAQ